MNRLPSKLLLGISAVAFCGIVSAADTQSKPAAGGTATEHGARQDSAGGPNSGSDTAGDTGSKGTQSGQNPAAGGSRQDTAGGTGSDSAGDTGSQGTQSGQNPRQNPGEEFAAEMRKCESMSGNDKTRCETDARKKHGQM